MHGVELLLKQRSICNSSIELVARMALLLRNDLTVRPSRAPSLNVWLASFNSGRGGAILSTNCITMLPSFLSNFPETASYDGCSSRGTKGVLHRSVGY